MLICTARIEGGNVGMEKEASDTVFTCTGKYMSEHSCKYNSVII
jgi:hypothetical protein